MHYACDIFRLKPEIKTSCLLLVLEDYVIFAQPDPRLLIIGSLERKVAEEVSSSRSLVEKIMSDRPDTDGPSFASLLGACKVQGLPMIVTCIPVSEVREAEASNWLRNGYLKITSLGAEMISLSSTKSNVLAMLPMLRQALGDRLTDKVKGKR